MSDASTTREGVQRSFAKAPIVGVVRTPTTDEAETLAREFMTAGLELIEITYTVPGAAELVRKLIAERGPSGPPWIGTGTITDKERTTEVLAAGAEFIVSPNVSPEVAEATRDAGVFLILGALTPTEIVNARQLGADLVKVYPLPPVGGADYLATVRQPLNDIPVLAAGGFGAEEIPEYRRAGAVAFGIGAPLLGGDPQLYSDRVRSALAAARGRE